MSAAAPNQKPNYRKTYGIAWSIPGLRERFLFVMAMFALYVAGQNWLGHQSGVIGLLDIVSGGNFRRISMIALGIMPYISAGIICIPLVAEYCRKELR